MFLKWRKTTEANFSIHYVKYGYTHNSLPRPGETADIFATSARSGEIKRPVSYSKIVVSAKS